MGPLIIVGDFRDIGVSGGGRSKAYGIAPPPLKLVESERNWSLYLQSLTLEKDFDSLIGKVFKPENEIFFTSIAWDYSGDPPYVYPGKNAEASKFLIPLVPPETRRFIGDGINLWPSKHVVGSLNLDILVYECDQKVRSWGKTLADIHDKVKDSELTTLITSISASPELASGAAIGNAVNELVGLIGKLLEKNDNDYVDLFNGSFGTDKPQSSRTEDHSHRTAGIKLDFNVS